MTESATTAPRPMVEELFATPPEYEIPSATDRYRYKKVGGSSDTAQTQDVFN